MIIANKVRTFKINLIETQILIIKINLTIFYKENNEVEMDFFTSKIL